MKIVTLLTAMLFLPQLLTGREAKLTDRAKGTAPYLVFFDATLDGSDVIKPPLKNGRREFNNLNYSWDFGDGKKVNWPHSSKEKNRDIGFLASHLYEAPGSYTATLTVSGRTGKKRTYRQKITVLDPDKVYSGDNTICFSNSGNFKGAPKGAQHISLDDITKLSDYASPGKRLLLRRGDSWTSQSGCRLQGQKGPLVIGAFGKGVNPDERGIFQNAPLIRVSGAFRSPFFSVSRCTGVTISDLHMVGSAEVASAIGGAIEIADLTINRMHIEGFRVGISFFHYKTDRQDGIRILNSHIYNSSANIVFTGGERLVVQGNLLHDAAQSHVLRVWQGYKANISHNVIHGSSVKSRTGRHALKFHGPSEMEINTDGPSHLKNRSGYSVIYDNIFGTCGPWPVTISPQNNNKEERIQDILIEGNRFLAGWGTPSEGSAPVSVGLKISANYVTVRNNIFDATGSGSSYYACWFTPSPKVPANGNRFINNTVFKNDFQSGRGSYCMLKTYEGAKDNMVINNLMLKGSSKANRVSLLNDLGEGTIAKSNLLIEDLEQIEDAGNSDILKRSFKLLKGSGAIDAGTSAPVFRDFSQKKRRNIKAIDIGAHEYQ